MCILNVAEKSIYVLLWLDENIQLLAFTAEKPAANFLMPAINQKKIGSGLYALTMLIWRQERHLAAYKPIPIISDRHQVSQ